MFEDGTIINELFIERLNYFIYVILLLIGLHGMIAKNNLIKKLIGMSIFQTAIILCLRWGKGGGNHSHLFTRT